MLSYVKLGVVALLPALMALLLSHLEKKTRLKNFNYIAKQIVYGVGFGLLAILGTEWGIPMNGAQVNCRDAAVLTAGFCFGGPAGIIAGVIGGVERWFSVYWGVGTFTRVACSVSTIIAGLYGALLRKFMFDSKKPSAIIAFPIGIVMEVFHLTMVFLTNMDNTVKAMEVVRACTVPMLVANAFSVAIACFLVGLVNGEYKREKNKLFSIAQIIQVALLMAVIVLFVVTTVFVYTIQNNIATEHTDSLLVNAISDVSDDIEDASDKNLLSKAREIKALVNNDKSYLDAHAEELLTAYDVSEISFVDENGKIFKSTDITLMGYDLNFGESDFLCLLGDTEEYVKPYSKSFLHPNEYSKYVGIKTEFGFIQVGYNSARFQQDIADKMDNITKNRHVGEEGYILIFDSNNKVISAPEVLSFMLGETIAEEYPENVDTTFSMSLTDTEDGTVADYFIRYHIVEGYSIVAIISEDEALQERNITLYVNTYMEILVFAIFFALIYQLIRHAVVYRMEHINKSMKEITNGNLDEKVNVRNSTEFSYLSDSINQTVDTLKNYIKEANERIDKELEFAKDIQKSALPSVYPAYPNRKDFDIYAFMDTAKEVGGDFYDYYLIGNSVLNFLVADVSGKGIPAALFMMRAKTELKSLTESGIPFADVFTKGNEALCEGNDAGMFVTAWQGKINLKTGEVAYTCAGHNPPIIIRKDGSAIYLKGRAGFVLAGMDGVRYKEQNFQLEEGDIIFLYTDGVTEATNVENQLFGEDRLLEALTNKEFADMKELCHSVKAKVDEFVGEAEQFDDITMVALKYIGMPPVPTISFAEASLDDIPAVTEFVEAEMEKRNIPMKMVINFSVAIDEIYSNIVKYGYPKAKKGPVTVKVIDHDNPKKICLKFEDEGVPYNPLTKADPDVTLSAEERQIGGLGIYMVKKTMDDIKYRYEDGKNVLTIMKNLEEVKK